MTKEIIGKKTIVHQKVGDKVFRYFGTVISYNEKYSGMLELIDGDSSETHILSLNSIVSMTSKV